MEMELYNFPRWRRLRFEDLEGILGLRTCRSTIIEQFSLLRGRRWELRRPQNAKFTRRPEGTMCPFSRL
jgi:hypothetical protein